MSTSAAHVISEEQADELAENEVLDEARDVVSNLEIRLQQVRTGSLDRDEAAVLISQDASNLRLKARTVAINGLAPITHRLDEYMSSIKMIEDQHIADLQTFGDRIGALLDGDVVTTEETAEVVRNLPNVTSFNVSDVTITDTEVTVVLPQRSAAHVVGRELAACGYRISTVLDPLEAIGLIVETRPDLVITTVVMPRLSGVDLACALAAMPSTKSIPVAVLTSLEPNHPDLAALPMNSGLIRRGPSFGDDLADVLHRFNIT
ncbi:PleD family two-component system response regulator [Pelagibius sp. Alg239-R121]|uniref:response regulator n=1 Tax=Pelagibius sp. Alg239-R121 TaxID=2993448 RepID=UPI0024A71D2E|nr:response regulator [Pelagibius sp. Alg239-R121]